MKLLEDREKDAFQRFLNNCEHSYEDVFIGRYVNPFRKPWQELGEEKQLLTLEKTEESTPKSEDGLDPVEVNKYKPD